MLKLLVGVIAGTVGLAAAAAGQDYPTRPVTMVIPFAAGGPTEANQAKMQFGSAGAGSLDR